MNVRSRDGISLVALLGVGVVVSLVVAFGVVIYALSRDLAELDDSDLIPVRHDVLASENGYFTCLDATNHFVGGEGWHRSLPPECKKMLRGEVPWDESFVAGVLATNALFLDAMEEVLEKPSFQMPGKRDFSTLLPHLSYLMAAGQLFGLRGSAELRDGRMESAALAAGSAIRLGRLQLQEPRSLVEALVGVATHHVGVGIHLAMAQAGVSPEQLRAWRLRDGGWELGSESLRLAFQGEYIGTKNTLQAMGAMSVSEVGQMVSFGCDNGDDDSWWMKRARIPGVLYQPKRTLGMFADMYRHYLIQAELPAWERDPDRIDTMIEESRAGMPFKRNLFGHIILGMLASSMGSAADRWTEHDMVARSVELVAALHAYRAAEGELPASLDALVPGYLEVVPVDLFDGKPMKYDRERGGVYSVGRDREDDGGAYDEEQTRPVSHGRKGEDLVILIDEPAAEQ